jgi:hypothetical protein
VHKIKAAKTEKQVTQSDKLWNRLHNRNHPLLQEFAVSVVSGRCSMYCVAPLVLIERAAGRTDSAPRHE